MEPLLMFVVAACLSFTVALATVRLQQRPSHLLVAVAVTCILACPLLIPAESIRLRAASALLSADSAFKVVDFCRHLRTIATPPSFSAYRSFLVPYPFLLVVFRERRILGGASWRAEIPFIAGAMVMCAIGLALTYSVTWLPLAHQNFLIDHVLRLTAFLAFLEAFSRVLFRLDRALGFDTSPLVDFVIASRTVAEFWQRYNTRVHSWFEANVFRRMPYRKSPATAVAAVFLVNGLLHELMFGVATSRFDGYQLLFFLLQIPAVYVSRPLRRWSNRNGGLAVATTHALTIVWMYGTSTLFFHGVNRIFPFYAATPWFP